jgi:protein-S-isoprenylcysteine O-methyltransferase Ste14
LIVYFTLHSALATGAAKTGLTKIIPPHSYRLYYNGLAIFLLIPLYWVYEKQPEDFLFQAHFLTTVAGCSLLVAGLTLIGAALKAYDLGEFFGLRQYKERTLEAHPNLHVEGINAWFRHPLYVGTFLVAWGIFLLKPTKALLITVVISTAYLYLGSRLEERKLTQQFGDAYRSYRAKVRF